MDNNLHFSQKGAMADVAASPNDPIFINHHTMIDCIMEEWIKSSINDRIYPTSSNIYEGHRKYDYIVPFIPLYTHSDIFHKSETFGYKCDLSNDDTDIIGTIAIAIFATLVGYILLQPLLVSCCIGIQKGVKKYRARKNYRPMGV